MAMKPNKADEVTFSVKGQIVVPGWLRREFGIERGTKALVYRDGEGIVLKPLTLQRYRTMRGSLKGTGGLNVLMAERKRERDL